jgi:hypothetical protein
LQFFFSRSLPFAAIVFTSAILDMFWAFYVSLCTHNMQGDGCKTWQGEKQTKQRAYWNCNSTFVLTSLITTSACNVKAHPTGELRLTLLVAPSPHRALFGAFLIRLLPHLTWFCI